MMEYATLTDEWERAFQRTEDQFNKHNAITERLLKLVEEIGAIATTAPQTPEMEAIQKLIVDRLGGDP